MGAEIHYSTEQVCERLLLTRRNIQWWDETGLINPGKDDRNCRTFSPALFRIMTIFCLWRKKGLKLRQIRKLKQKLHYALNGWPGDQNIFIVTDGVDVRATTTVRTCLTFALEASRAVTVVYLSPNEPSVVFCGRIKDPMNKNVDRVK